MASTSSVCTPGASFGSLNANRPRASGAPALTARVRVTGQRFARRLPQRRVVLLVSATVSALTPADGTASVVSTTSEQMRVRRPQLRRIDVVRGAAVSAGATGAGTTGTSAGGVSVVA